MDVYTFTSKSYDFTGPINSDPLISGMNIGRVYHTIEYSNTPYLLSGYVEDGNFIYYGPLTSGVEYPCGRSGKFFPSGTLFEYGLIPYNANVIKPSGLGFTITGNHTTHASTSGVIKVSGTLWPGLTKAWLREGLVETRFISDLSSDVLIGTQDEHGKYIVTGWNNANPEILKFGEELPWASSKSNTAVALSTAQSGQYGAFQVRFYMPSGVGAYKAPKTETLQGRASAGAIINIYDENQVQLQGDVPDRLGATKFYASLDTVASTISDTEGNWAVKVPVGVYRVVFADQRSRKKSVKNKSVGGYGLYADKFKTPVGKYLNQEKKEKLFRKAENNKWSNFVIFDTFNNENKRSVATDATITDIISDTTTVVTTSGEVTYSGVGSIGIEDGRLAMGFGTWVDYVGFLTDPSLYPSGCIS